MKKRTIPALLLALALLLPAGCGGSGSSMKSEAADSAMSPQTSAMPAASEVLDTSWLAEEDGGELNMTPSSPEEAAEGQKPVDLTEKIIYSADLSIETMEFDAAVAGLEKLAFDMGGFVASSQVSGYTNRLSDGSTRVVDRWASYVLRVPAARFQDALHQAGALGSVTSSSSNAENITSQFTDQEARKHSLEVQEERLLSMLERAEDVDTLIALEQRLSEVRYEIESIERTLRNWQNEVDYSTISVQLQEVAVYTPTTGVQRSFSQRLADAFQDGWNGFVGALQAFVLWMAGALPMLILVAVAAALVVVIIRGARRRALRRRAGGPQQCEKGGQ